MNNDTHSDDTEQIPARYSGSAQLSISHGATIVLPGNPLIAERAAFGGSFGEGDETVWQKGVEQEEEEEEEENEDEDEEEEM
ncbi:hypothetical protein K0M31_017664 [Melipona bicolor]|uniref:Uncharacterized protein n=1 Tax=Melipona bicolor TaxID=60889 RepID=A0AA40G5Q2_9HYME|nr:hypothetical protein K0M31_017664 [Melipona bicolor]